MGNMMTKFWIVGVLNSGPNPYLSIFGWWILASPRPHGKPGWKPGGAIYVNVAMKRRSFRTAWNDQENGVRCHINLHWLHGTPRKLEKDLLIMNMIRMIRMIRAFLGGSKVVYTWPAASPKEAVLEISDVFQETPPEAAPLRGQSGKPWETMGFKV